MKNNSYITSLSLDDWPDFKPVLNLCVMSSGKGTNFEAIVSSIKSGRLKAKVSILIVNNKDCEALQRAKRLGIEYKVIDNHDFNSREAHDIEIINHIRKYRVDLIVMAGWMRIISKELINTYKNRIINIHPSLLPSFKGVDAITQSLDYGVKIIGCTVHIVDEEVDCGKILAQSALIVECGESKERIIERIHDQEHLLLPKAIAKMGKDYLRVNSQ